MCNTNQQIVLAETQTAQITWCKVCKRYTLLFSSCCLSFSEEEIKSFRVIIASLEEDDFHYKFLNRSHALIKNRTANMGMSITRSEQEILIALLDEATAVNEVFSIIYQ